MQALTAYSGLFAAAFLSATLLPSQSEVVLAGLLLTDQYLPWLLLLVASTGNTLGAVANWFCGRFIAQFEGRSWFPVSPKKMAGAEAFYRRYGRWSLLLSWVPFGGDALTVVAGVLRESLLVFVALVAVAKTARYLAIWALTDGWI